MTGSWLWPAGRVSRRGFALLYLLPVAVLRVILQMVVRMGDVHLALPFALVVWAVLGAVLLVGLAKRAHDCGRAPLEFADSRW